MKKYVVSIFILIFIILSSNIFASEDRVSLGYIYNSSKSHTQIMNNTFGNINTVSPTCFDLTSTGHLEINNIFNQEFVNEMHNQGVLVTPFLSNHWGRKKAQAALRQPEVLADEVVNAIIKYNLDGVNVDLENLHSSDKDKLTKFVKILRKKMPKDKILTVAVAANPKKLTTTWLATYDYKALAEYSDYLVLMAYDEHSSGGREGPVASRNFVKESIEVILEEVSRDKVVLGIPLYGRYWKMDSENGGEAIVISQVELIAKRYNVVPIYDDVTGTATVKLNVKEGEKKAYVNGRYLDEGNYTIYYENENSISKKLELMNNYGLKGAALWALGNENDEFWKWYSKGFENQEYESEKSVEERAFYEYVEVLKSKVEPLKLERQIEIYNKNKNGNINKKIDEKYILPNTLTLPMLTETNEKVSDKVKSLNKIDKIKIVRIVKRYGDMQ